MRRPIRSRKEAIRDRTPWEDRRAYASRSKARHLDGDCECPILADVFICECGRREEAGHGVEPSAYHARLVAPDDCDVYQTGTSQSEDDQ